MHMHVITDPMRTTVEMKPEHRAALLSLAAKRGEKGFSGVLEQAIDAFLAGESEREARKQKLLALDGVLSNEEADDLRRITRTSRESRR